VNKQQSISSEQIKIRHPEFQLNETVLREFRDREPFKAHFFAAMSLMFPTGEKFFIDSVRYYRDRITDPELSQAVSRFCGQEGIHTREHLKYNELLKSFRIEPERVYRRLEKKVAFYNKMQSEKTQLAVVLAFEHFTAILADILLRRPEILDGADPKLAALWRWHSIEELEHKAVAFDVYRSIGGGYIRRLFAMLFITLQFAIDLNVNLLYLLRRDRLLLRPSVFFEGIRFLFFRPGILIRLLPEYLKYFAPGFHPWKKNNFTLVEKWENGIRQLASPAGR